MVDYIPGTLMIYGNVLINIMKKDQNIQNTGGRTISFIMKRAWMKMTQGRESYILNQVGVSVILNQD